MSTTSRAERMAAAEKTIFEGLIEALAGKHSQLDLNFQKVSLRLPGMQMGVELNGVITIAVHMRDLTDQEKQALASKNVAMVSTATA
jgi:hypothetical protein